MWNFLTAIEKKDDITLDFKFKENPPYQEVGFYLMYQVPIVPEAPVGKPGREGYHRRRE